MKKIAVITGTRAEYSIFYPLLKKLKQSKDLKLQLLVTGMHLSPEYGYTYNNILDDGFEVLDKVEMLLSSDSDVGLTKSMGLGMIGFADVFARLKPDALLVLGDRIETYAASVAAFIAKIPICHFHGGEITEGMIDDGIRHSITKMSTYHFASSQVYRNRIIQMGESPDRVFDVGALSLDNLLELSFMSKMELEKSLGFEIKEQTVLFTYHPESLEHDEIKEDLDEIFSVLEKLKHLRIVFTLPNSDSGNHIISSRIKDFVDKNSDRSIYFCSLGLKRYFSALKYVSLVMGNSSSGIIEVPSFKIPTINIGNRQKGRIRANSVIDVDIKREAIEEAVNTALSKEVLNSCMTVVNPCDGSGTSDKVMTILDSLKFDKNSVKKEFFDINIKG